MQTKVCKEIENNKEKNKNFEQHFAQCLEKIFDPNNFVNLDLNDEIETSYSNESEDIYFELSIEKYLEQVENLFLNPSSSTPIEFTSHLLNLQKISLSKHISLKTKFRINNDEKKIIEKLIIWTHKCINEV